MLLMKKSRQGRDRLMDDIYRESGIRSNDVDLFNYLTKIAQIFPDFFLLGTELRTGRQGNFIITNLGCEYLTRHVFALTGTLFQIHPVVTMSSFTKKVDFDKSL